MTGFQVEAIGWVESPLTEQAQAPRQGDEGAPDAWLVFEPPVADGLRDIAAGTDIIVLTWLDRADREVLVTRPRDDPARPLTGVFSTRSPRPSQSHRAAQGAGPSYRGTADPRQWPGSPRQDARYRHQARLGCCRRAMTGGAARYFLGGWSCHGRDEAGQAPVPDG